MIRKNSESEVQGFEMLKRMILKNLGLNCDYYRDNYLVRRIHVRMNHYGVCSYWDYMKILRNNKDEWSLLIRDLTINYTSFFRDPDVFSYFKTRILPSLLSKKKIIRILSAGCSSGEEPYTISMIINDVLKSKVNRYLVSIYAVDIDETALKRAIKGEYEKRAVEKISKEYLQKYFEKVNGKYRIKKCVKRLVHFKKMDLTQGVRYKNLDVIFCRNILIYFFKKAQAKICMDFYDALNYNGYLILGKTEILPEEVADKFTCVDVDRRVFQKI